MVSCSSTGSTRRWKLATAIAGSRPRSTSPDGGPPKKRFSRRWAPAGAKESVGATLKSATTASASPRRRRRLGRTTRHQRNAGDHFSLPQPCHGPRAGLGGGRQETDERLVRETVGKWPSWPCCPTGGAINSAAHVFFMRPAAVFRREHP